MSALADYYRAQAGEISAREPLLAAQTSQAQAQARLTGVTADQLPVNDAARRGVEGAQAGLLGQQSQFFGPTALSEIAGRQAATTSLGIHDSILGQTTASDLATQALQRQGLQQGLSFYAKGTSKVTKAKQGTPNAKDTVPAMLRPGEAVLNKGAVAHYGTNVITHMNQMGVMRDKAHKELAKSVKMAGQKKAKRKGTKK